MGRFSNSLTLGKESWNVLRQDKELAVIPVASAVVCSVIAVAFGGAAYFTFTTVANPQPGQDSMQPTPVTWAVGIVGLFVLGLVAQYFTAALIAGANQRLEGGSPTLGSAMSRANKRIGAVLGWAAINVTVGLVLQAIADRAGPLGAFVLRLVGMAWNVVTWLALPAIVIGDLGAVDGIKTSVQLLRKTWGENLIAQGGLGILGLLVILPGVLVFGAITALGLPIVGIPLLFLYVAVASAILSALNGIFRAALYRYAVGLPNTGAFSDAQLAGAFKAR